MNFLAPNNNKLRDKKKLQLYFIILINKNNNKYL